MICRWTCGGLGRFQVRLIPNRAKSLRARKNRSPDQIHDRSGEVYSLPLLIGPLAGWESESAQLLPASGVSSSCVSSLDPIQILYGLIHFARPYNSPRAVAFDSPHLLFACLLPTSAPCRTFAIHAVVFLTLIIKFTSVRVIFLLTVLCTCPFNSK